MGSKKRRATSRSTKTAQKLRFPLGELAQRRHDLKENFLSKSKELNSLRKKHKRIKEKIENMKSGFGSGKATIVPSPTFAVSEKTSFERKKSPTQTSFTPEINTNIPLRSKYRRIQETLLAVSEINGGSKENRQPAIDGLFLTVDRYASVETCMKYLGSSTKLRDASVLLHKKHVSKFEASQENVTRSLSMLYAGGLLSKRKYAQNRSALSTFSTGNVTEKGYLQRKRLLFSGGIPIPKILPYKDLMHIVNNVDIGELLPVANLSSHLPSEDKVDGVYRNLETLLVSLAKFYLDTDCYRKPEDRLRWFGGEFGHFRVAVGGDKYSNENFED